MITLKQTEAGIVLSISDTNITRNYVLTKEEVEQLKKDLKRVK